MRNISFAMTKDQIMAGTKTVTRRLGWAWLKPGTVLQGVEKGQGLKKGEKVKPLRVIRVLNVRREPLNEMIQKVSYGLDECVKEGYENHSSLRFPSAFVEHFCAANRPCQPWWVITRIEFEYV